MRKTPERIEKLAAEYVLGSLRGQARARFERWMMETYQVRQEVWFWEMSLSGLNRTEALQPSADSWARISQRLWPELAAESSVTNIRKHPGFWRPLSLMATAAALVLALVLTATVGERAQESELIAAMAGADQTQWLFNTDGSREQLQMRAVSAAPAAPDKDYELWVLPKAGDPVSLGVIKATGERIVIDLTLEQRRQLMESRQLAISLEPKGGSPTSTPTGPVLHVAELLAL